MRVLLIAIVIVSGLWAGYWALGKRTAEQGMATLLDTPRAAWSITYDDIAMSGFPNRYDTTLTAPVVEGAWGRWQAPFLQILRLTYQPKHAIVIWPDRQRVSVGAVDITVESAQARGSFVFSGPDWGLETSVITAARVALSGAEPLLEATEARLATRPSERAPGAIDLGLALPTPVLGREALRYASLDAALSLSAPLGGQVLDAGLPSLRQIDIADARLTWEEAELRVSGVLDITASGSIAGQLELRFKDWPSVLERLRRISVLNPALADTLQNALQDSEGPDASVTFELPSQPLSELWGR